MLVSIQLNSNRPQNIIDFVDNVETTASNPQEIEIIFHIDEGDDVCKNLLDELKVKSKVKIKYLQTNIIKGYKDLWKPLNEILKITDPNAYFVTNFSDEFKFLTKGWDDILKKYINYYEDDVFRIRLSNYRFRNYVDFWECIYAPDSLAFYTKKWMDTVGTWCPCLGPDSWQQLVAFYLINSRKFDHIQYNRDIPESFIKFEGEGASIGLTGQKAAQRVKDNVDLWFETVSHEMQEKAKHAAAKLQTAIIMHKNLDDKKISYNFTANRKPPLFHNKNLKDVSYTDNVQKKQIEFFYNNRLLYKISYKLNKLKLFLINNFRKPNYGYYAGGGQECYRKDFISQLNVYIRMRRSGIYKNDLILTKPKFFKKNKILGFTWTPIKIILTIIILLKRLIFKIIKTSKFLEKYNPSIKKILNKFTNFLPKCLIFYGRLARFFFQEKVFSSLPKKLRIKFIKTFLLSFFSISKKNLIECNREIANFWFRAGYADEMAEILKITLDYKFSTALMYNYFGCLLFTSPENYTHKKYLESMLYFTDKYIPYKPQGSFKIDDLNPNKKLKVGYICHFFSSNISQLCLWPFISLHDKNNFDIYVLSDDIKAKVKENDPQKYAEFKKTVNFIDTSNFSVEQFCQFVTDNQFDILLEMNGYCDFNRYVEINKKIAPIQISCYNISGTTGLRGIDYIFNEPLTNIDKIQPFYTEKFFQLKHSSTMQLCDYYPLPYKPAFIENDYITFGSFGATHKINRNMIRIWSEILKKVPNSKIFIKAGALYDPDIITIFKKNFRLNEINSNRIIFEDFEPHKEMLKKYSKVDIALDTFPHNAGTTTIDCLMMGIPIIALDGERLCSQHAKMLIGAIGHLETVAKSEEEYIKKAVDLANDKEKIMFYRENLRKDYLKSEKNDFAGFAKDFENSFREMWLNFLKTPSNQKN